VLAGQEEIEMSNENGSDVGAFLAGFIIGGLVGAAAALILAPQSGEETRAQIASQSAHLREAGSERMHDYRDRAGEYSAHTRQAAHDRAAHLQDQARIVLDHGRSGSAGDAGEEQEEATNMPAADSGQGDVPDNGGETA